MLSGLYIGINKRYRNKYFPLPGMRLTNGWGTNILPCIFTGHFLCKGVKMKTGVFYYIKDEYYDKFKNCNLMGNKEDDETGKHGRPCYYCFEQNGFYWMIPISSQIDKFQRLYNEKSARYKGEFDGIRFGYVNGNKRAFLIQNMCPVTEKYIGDEYKIENNTVRVTINNKLAKELNAVVRKVLRLYYDKGIKIILTDLDTILDELESELQPAL